MKLRAERVRRILSRDALTSMGTISPGRGSTTNPTRLGECIMEFREDPVLEELSKVHPTFERFEIAKKSVAPAMTSERERGHTLCRVACPARDSRVRAIK